MTNAALAVLLDALQPDGPISHNHQASPTDTFHGRVVQPDELVALVDQSILSSQWVSIATLDPALVGRDGRGRKVDIRRLMALPCDFDVKAGAFDDKDAIDACIDDIITNLGFQPVLTVDTGHGLQPWWPLSAADPQWRCSSSTDPRWAAINAILKRWSRYVRWECEKHGAGMDGVFDASRVMRIPNTLNTKEEPVAVTVRAEFEDWEPITYAQLDEALESLGFPQLPEDLDVLGEQVFDFDGFTAPETTCAYAKGIIAGLATEVPGSTGRHPWLTGKATRLWALYRYGCVSTADINAAFRQLRTRFLEICADPTIGGGQRAEGPNEIKDAIRDMRAKVATWSAAKVAAEFTTAAGVVHDHTEPTMTLFADQLAAFDQQREAVQQSQPVVQVAEPPATTLARSEDGHSQALIGQFGDDLRYCPEMGRWLHWDGFRWHKQPAGGGIAREFAKAVARAYPDGEGWTSHKKRSLSSSGISACLSLAETDYRVTVGIDELDARPWELNTPGGIVDLRTGTLRPADPRSLHTRSTLVAPDPDADADASPWHEFLLTTFQGDLEVIGFIQRLMGYACVGAVREAILPVFYGQGANGKTVLLETVQAVLGDYATVAPQKFLVQGPNQHATEIAALAGARLVIASETNEGERFDEAKVKLLTGGDRIKARFMRQDEFTFTPSHLLVMMTNHRPEVGSGGTSFWRRVREVPFTHIVPEAQRDPELKERLVEQHGAAIMAWLATGAAAYARDGLREPEGVRVATQAYEASTDTVARFVDDMVILGGGEAVKTRSSAVRDAYEAWCRAEGETPVAPKTLTTQLMGKFGISMHKGTKGARFLTGMTLAGSATDEPLDAPPATAGSDWGGS
jgi:P4 family phage/plasmid primase-like protien